MKGCWDKMDWFAVFVLVVSFLGLLIGSLGFAYSLDQVFKKWMNL